MVGLPPLSAGASLRGTFFALGKKIASAYRTLMGTDVLLKASKRIMDVPQASVDEVYQTLATPRFRIFGFSFGGTKRISDVRLFTDVSGWGLSASARVDGRRVAIEGDLLARLVEGQFEQMKQKALAQAGHQASLPKPAAPQPVRCQTPPGSAAASPSLSAGSYETELSALYESMSQDGAAPGTLTPATSVGSAEAPNQVLRASYLQEARQRGYFATLAELVATAHVIKANIRVIMRNTAGDVTTGFSVQDIISDPSEQTPLHTVVLSRLHYEPVSPAIGDANHKNYALLTPEALAHIDSGKSLAATDKALRKLTGTAQPDGSCFFHSIATLLWGIDSKKLTPTALNLIDKQAQQLRQRAVDYIAANGKSHELGGTTLEGIALDAYEEYLSNN